MVFSQRTLPVLLVAGALVVGLAACSGNSTAGAGGGSGSGSKSGGGSGKTVAASASFSGTESGTATASTCTSDPGMGIYVVVKGSSDKLPGAISKTTMDFNGSDSIYTLDKSGALPQFASDGNSIKLDGVKLKSIIDPSKEVTFSGTLTCP
jgi:hypothetical protein